jgi:hypothetical protein
MVRLAARLAAPSVADPADVQESCEGIAQLVWAGQSHPLSEPARNGDKPWERHSSLIVIGPVDAKGWTGPNMHEREQITQALHEIYDGILADPMPWCLIDAFCALEESKEDAESELLSDTPVARL